VNLSRLTQERSDRDDTAATTWLTPEAHDRLKAELDELSGPGRADITAKIASARDEGDLKENGGYHAAREEQGKHEARIRELTVKLRNVEIGSPADDASSSRAWSSRLASRATR